MINRLHALRKSFSAKIIVILIVTMVCMAALFDFILISIQKKTFESSLSTHGTTLVQMLSHTVRLAVFTENQDEMLTPVEGLLLQDNVVEVVIWNQEGKVLLQKTKDPTGRLRINAVSKEMQATLDSLQISGQLSRETRDSFIYWGQISIKISSNTEGNWYFDEEDDDSDWEVLGSTAVILSKEFFRIGVRNILIQTGVSVLVFLCIGILITFFIIRKVTEPLRSLMLAIRKREDDTKSRDDLTVLTATYDIMLEDLEKSFETINELNDELEMKVKHRTILLTMANAELSKRQRKLEGSNTNLTKALSQLEDTQEQLIQKEKLAAVGQLVAGVAHEINNTVNFISGALPSLHRSLDEVKEIFAGYEEIEKARKLPALDEKFDKVKDKKAELAYNDLFSTIDQLMENIDEGTIRTTSIIRDLKTFSREDSETIIPLNLHAAIDSTIDFIDKELLINITIQRDYESIPLVYCLPGRISQVFLNIMHNAIQAMDGTGRLIITTQHKKKYVHIFFSDTGCGIASHNLPKIFDPFFTNKEIGKGSGLGLSISYTIIRQHDGEIKVRSEEGKGTVFEVILPRESKDIRTHDKRD